MTIETELRSFVIADATVTGLIGDRMYPVRAPQAPVKPYITYQRVSGQRLHDLDGALGWARPRFQLDCWATTYLGALTLAGAVRSRLNGFHGTLTTLRVAILLENSRDDYEEEPDLYRVIQDYIINHAE